LSFSSAALACALRVAAEQGHESFAVQVGVATLLVTARQLRGVGVRLDEAQIESRLLLDRDVGTGDQTGAQAGGEGGQQASAGSGVFHFFGYPLI
jgi:hypothetical protein